MIGFWGVMEGKSPGTRGGFVYSSVDIPLPPPQKMSPASSSSTGGWELAHCAMDRLSMLRFLKRPVPGLTSPTLNLGMQFSMR